MTESENVCRACLESVGPYYYVLFENVSAYMFWFCTQIQIAEHESLPKALCTKCYELLSKFAAFKQKCIDSQNSLLNVKNVKSEADCTGTPKDTINEQTNLEEHIIFKKENQFDEKLKNDTFKYEYENFASDDDDEQLDVNICKQQNNDRLKIPEKIYTYHCELCDKRFIRNKRYENHKRTHESEGLSCMSCDKTFKTKRGLREHQKNVHSPWSFNETKCRLCGKVFKSRNSLKQHEIRHGERKLYICDVCGKKCLSKSYLKIHLETHNEKKERNYGCDICNKKFFSKMYLNTHIHRAHTGRQYTCQLCNITYKYKDNLVKHLLTHEGKKLFKCDYCNKSFSTRKYCVEHQRAHSGERPFSCLYCPKKFMNKRHLSDHHKIHTGERKHKCAVCEQSFTQRGTMMRHMKIHNKAPLAC
ncbi:zinc finger protein 782-like [Zerene cesonia]|uniref:zinc finger protein 782-like n=1 Tax=Zerene cesonia TaxID=33412 RepID=UPI0018E5708A|nr:zinc finger protein 782-like [Zerene cesonia]